MTMHAKTKRKIKAAWDRVWWWAKMTRIQKVGLLLLVLAVVIALVGYLNQHRGLYLGKLAENLLQDYYANFSAELASIAITVLIIDALYRRRDIEREKRDLILQMGSPDNAFAREAARRLRAQGWLEDGTLSGVYLVGADLSRANLSRANLSGAELSRANLGSANLIRADLTGANLTEADLMGTKLISANLSGAKLRGVMLCNADLNRANLSGANLEGANLVCEIKTNLEWGGARWYGEDANLEGTNLEGANLKGAQVTDEQLAQAASLKGATLPDGTKHD